MEYGLVVWWLVAYLALTVAGMPLAAVLFHHLPGRGAGFALPLALAIVWVVAFFVGHLSLAVALPAALVVLFGSAGVAVYRGVEYDVRRYGEVALVFAIAFLFMVAIRAVDAGAHPIMGEKFIDYGLLNAVLRAEVLPPEDMWFAGQPIRYYYGGHLLAALLTRLTGTAPQYGYNLALAGFYGMYVTAAYGLAGSIGATRGISRIRAGAFGAFFVGFASNLSTPGRFLVWILPDGVSSFLADLGGFEIERLAANGPEGFWYWSASRVIDGTINEFPLFAWLNGDMHAHMMSTPFVLVVAAVLFSYYRTPAAETRRRRLLVFGTVPPLGALIAVFNTWSFPVVGGLVFLTLALAPTDPVTMLPDRLQARLTPREDWRRELDRHVLALVGAAVVLVLAVGWALPYWPVRPSSGGIGFFPDRSSMGGLLAVHGAFVAIFAIHLVRHALPEVDREHRAEVAVMLGLGVFVAWIGASVAAVALLGPMVVVAWILLRSHAGPIRDAARRSVDAVPQRASDGGDAIAGTGGTEPADATPAPDSSSRGVRDTVGYETLLFVAGAGIVLIVEFAFVKEQAGPSRMNTVFKSYVDVWALWAVAAGAMLATFLENHSPDLGLSEGQWQTGLRVFAVVIVVSTSMYGAFAVTNHLSGEAFNPNAHPDEPTLDALHFVEREHPDEAPAIAWFNRIEGQPNIVEAPGRGTEMYDWTNPVSSLTGLPTVAGWAHEVGYRGGDVFRTRVDHVDTIYTGTPAERAYYLDVYEVEYVYVGSNELQEYGQGEISTFEEMDGVTLEQRWDYVRIYKVDQDELSYPGRE